MFWARFLNGILPHFRAWEYFVSISKSLPEDPQEYLVFPEKTNEPAFCRGHFYWTIVLTAN